MNLLEMLEMIRGWPSTLSGGWNEVFASRLMGTDGEERTFTERENKREIKGQITVVSRTVSLTLCIVQKEVIERREENRSETEQSAKKTSGPSNQWLSFGQYFMISDRTH